MNVPLDDYVDIRHRPYLTSATARGACGQRFVVRDHRVSAVGATSCGHEH